MRRPSRRPGPNYFDVTVWGGQGENCDTYLEKGRPVAVDGRLEWREWDDQNGNKRQGVDIIADTVQFFGSRDSGDDDGRFAAASDGRAADDFAEAPDGAADASADDDNPF